VSFMYLGFLLLSLFCLGLIDHRHKLAFWYDHRRTLKVFVLAITLFLVWDIIGISAGIFFSGGSPYASEIFLLPELPLEELFFLGLLVYTTLLVWRWQTK
jgi:lycopene cyclase domain-containing protein